MAELSWLDRVRNALFPKLQKRKETTINAEGYRRFMKWVAFANMAEALCRECGVHYQNSALVTRIIDRHIGAADLLPRPELDAELDRIAQLEDPTAQRVAFLKLLTDTNDELALNAALLLTTQSTGG